MARRLGGLIGAAAVLLALARLTRLLQPQVDGPPWELVLGAAAVLGAVVTWTAIAYRLGTAWIVALGTGGALLAAIRVTAPSTLLFGVVPTSSTIGEVGTELGYAIELIRFGAAPVLPVAGLVGILAIVFWALGGLAAAGAARSNTALAALPGLAFYLQLATLDRRPPGWGWLVAFLAVSAATLAAIGPGSDPRSGRVRDPDGLLLPRRSRTTQGVALGLVALVAASTTSVFAGTVPESGVLAWRSQSGLGSGLYGGGTSINPFVGLQQQLVDLGDDPVFYARLSESAPPNEDLYWTLLTLELFDGENWRTSQQEFSKAGGTRWEREDLAFQGPTVPVGARIQIAGYRDQVLPVLYSPVSLSSDVELISESFRVREDGSVSIDVTTRPGWEYQITANVPQPDLAQLASVGGELSPIFREASDRGDFAADPRPPVFTPRPDDIDRYLELPDGVPLDVRKLTREVTADGVTRFEDALLLESWFRDTGEFTYSVDVSTGHSTLDLGEWLLDPESRNYRTGYCEQFATAMGVMARTIGIPSRVVLGFTPGEVQRQSDGSEIVVVRERNAHAWVELWMDGQGWVRFDPTPRGDGANPSLSEAGLGFDPRRYIPAPEEPDLGPGNTPNFGERLDIGPEVLAGADDPGAVLAGDETPFRMPAWVWWLLALIAAGSVIPGTKYVRYRRRIARIRTGDVTAAWEEIVDRLTDLGVGIDPSLTPTEIARRHDQALVPLASMYSARVYGGRRRGDGRAAYAAAISSIDRRYQPGHRASSWFVPTSLRRR